MSQSEHTINLHFNNLKSQITNLKSQNLKYQISNIKCQISNIKSQISNLKSQISNVKCQMSNIKFQVYMKCIGSVSILKISKHWSHPLRNGCDLCFESFNNYTLPIHFT